MSLKFVHQIIIFAGISIALIFAWFCFFDPSTTGNLWFHLTGAGSLLAAGGLVRYEFHFLKKTRRLITE